MPKKISLAGWLKDIEHKYDPDSKRLAIASDWDKKIPDIELVRLTPPVQILAILGNVSKKLACPGLKVVLQGGRQGQPGNVMSGVEVSVQELYCAAIIDAQVVTYKLVVRKTVESKSTLLILGNAVIGGIVGTKSGTPQVRVGGNLEVGPEAIIGPVHAEVAGNIMVKSQEIYGEGVVLVSGGQVTMQCLEEIAASRLQILAKEIVLRCAREVEAIEMIATHGIKASARDIKEITVCVPKQV